MNKKDLIKETIEFRDSNPSMSWRDIANALNTKYGLNHDTSTYNRWYNKSQDTITRVFVERKRSVMMRTEIHKMAKDLAIKEQMVEKLHEITKLPKVKTRVQKAPKGKEIIEIVIADLHYKGGEKEIANVNAIFQEAVNAVKANQNPKAEYRISFLGDDIEGMGAHESQLLNAQEVATQQTIEIASLYITGVKEVFKAAPAKAKKSIVFVPYSNHGLAYGTHKGRYQFPTNDYGVIILSMMRSMLDKDIFIYKEDNDKFIVETDDTIYTHGHQGYMKNKVSMMQTLGVDKHIFQGHLHHIEMLEERNRSIVKFPTCRREFIDYEKMAGYNPSPQITLVKRSDNKMTFEFIRIGG